MKAGSLVRWISTFAAALLLAAQAASAAEVRVMISAGFFGAYSDLLPAFERASGHKEDAALGQVHRVLGQQQRHLSLDGAVPAARRVGPNPVEEPQGARPALR